MTLDEPLAVGVGMKFLTKLLPYNLKKISWTIILSIFSCLALADYTLNMSPGVSEISRRTYHLHMTIFWICVIIGIVVFSVLIYALIMHRKSIGHKAHEFHENTVIEIIWTVIPFIILISMAVPATSVLKFIDDKSNSDLIVKITGYQWRWQYEYPEHDISFFSNLLTTQEQIDNKDTKDSSYLRSVDNPVVLPTGKKIRFLFTANDVIHSWWVPKLGIKKDTIPGFINESWVIIDEPGMYYGQCTELCGARHGYMPIVVDARTPEEYQKWVDSKKKKPAQTPKTEPTETVKTDKDNENTSAEQPAENNNNTNNNPALNKI